MTSLVIAVSDTGILLQAQPHNLFPADRSNESKSYSSNIEIIAVTAQS